MPHKHHGILQYIQVCFKVYKLSTSSTRFFFSFYNVRKQNRNQIRNRIFFLMKTIVFRHYFRNSELILLEQRKKKRLLFRVFGFDVARVGNIFLKKFRCAESKFQMYTFCTSYTKKLIQSFIK